jgi:hypothetical protein
MSVSTIGPLVDAAHSLWAGPDGVGPTSRWYLDASQPPRLRERYGTGEFTASGVSVSGDIGTMSVAEILDRRAIHDQMRDYIARTYVPHAAGLVYFRGRWMTSVNAALMDAIVNGRYRMVQYVVEGTSGFDINGQDFQSTIQTAWPTGCAALSRTTTRRATALSSA